MDTHQAFAHDGLIAREVGRTLRNLRRVGWALVIAALVGTAVAGRYLYNVFTGPHAPTTAQLLAITDADDCLEYFVTIPAEGAVDTGITDTRRRNRGGRKTRSVVRFVAVPVGERFLLVSTAFAPPAAAYTGSLHSMDDRRRAILASLQPGHPDAAVFLPYWLRADRNFAMGSYLLLPIIGAVLLTGLGLLTLAARRRSRPTTLPIHARLRRLGDPAALAASIDDEAKVAARPLTGVILTHDWIVQAKTFTFHVMRLDDLVWCHLGVTQNRIEFVPIGKSFAARLHDHTGTTLALGGKEHECQTLLDCLAKRVPWAMHGHTAEREKMWRQRRPDVLAIVASRRAELTHAGPAGARDGATGTRR